MISNKPIFSLAYTTVRAKAVPDVVRLWNERSKFKDHEWIITPDEGDTATTEAAQAACVSSVSASQCRSASVVVNKGSKDCNAGWNTAAAATTGKVIICVADDFLPPQNWDEALLNLSPKGWEDGEYVVKVSDGYVEDIFVLSILTRARYEKFGYVFYPKYRSMFNDKEFGEVAKCDGVVILANSILFEHLHPDCGKRTRDEVDLVHASSERWKASEMLYNFRKARNFPLDDGPKAVKYTRAQDAGADDKYVAYLQVTKDDICLLEVCQRLVDEGVRDFAFCVPDKYWSGEVINEADRKEVLRIIESLKLLNVTVHTQLIDVDSHVVTGQSRIQTETRVRNASVAWIKKLGYKHVLIVDGDELWIPGLFNIVKGYVKQGHKVVSVRMIPVIGLPGYPVEGATDLAVVYVESSCVFESCRTPFMQQTRVPRPLIYHFTGTRKTMEETIVKHRRSGHYDDSDYDFEGWIKNKLPNIAPGMKDAHMYTPYQIWPNVRAWRQTELDLMPATLRPYLGTV